ncbi:hypothetical protein NRB16_27200 [Pseudomonas sp. LJDD11]|uniref:hypothetical protein n=1 Tax=Pseudomonas sp. LJDD11 TaxID=2931984 RepID=UPI00211C0897|nr:hypothetical protein [Pseudomonas sp. LJDD11]MCQ9427204.1 hypothetical protein [Pseudomonas sp. LJDD11]
MKRSQRGSASIEAAIALSVVITAGLLVSDLYLLSRARADLERSTASLSSTLSNQNQLTAEGVDALLDALVAERGDRYQFHVGKVLLDGTVSWQLALGAADGLCDSPLGSDTYQGPLPERDPEADNGRVALLVVRGCQDSDQLGMGSLGLGGKVLQADAISRLRMANIKLDEALSNQAGIPYVE